MLKNIFKAMVKKSYGKIKTIFTNNDKIFKLKGKEFRFVMNVKLVRGMDPMDVG
jgi:hypothetical protein